MIFPKQITFDQANTIAENWTKILEEKFNDQVRISNGHTIRREGIIVAYVFDFYPKGYLMISSEDYMPPIKMYSLKNDFNTTGAPLEDLIFDRNSKVIKFIKEGKIRPREEDLKRNRASFKKLLNRDIRYMTYDGLNETKEDLSKLSKNSSSWVFKKRHLVLKGEEKIVKERDRIAKEYTCS